MTRSKAWVRAVVAVLAAVVFLMGMMEYRAGRETALARAAAAQGADEEAAKHYTRALNWYVPFGSAETAAEEMLALGLARDQEGRSGEAILYLSRMRSGLYGARSLFTPRPDLIARAEPVLARLRAVQKLGPDAEPSELQAKTDQYLEIMRRPSRPATLPALAAVGGFFLWAAAGLWFIFSFFSFKKRGWLSGWLPAALFALGFAAWIWGMIWA